MFVVTGVKDAQHPIQLSKKRMSTQYANHIGNSSSRSRAVIQNYALSQESSLSQFSLFAAMVLMKHTNARNDVQWRSRWWRRW